jgi:DNA-binding transcriptional MerR regulator
MENSGAKYYQIGGLANLLGLSSRTIRYYEEIGLLNSVKRKGEKGSIQIRIFSV